MSKITSKQRNEVETAIYQIMDILDPTHANTQWYMEKFSGMSNDQFYEYFKQDFPIKFQMKLFEIEPKMDQIMKCSEKLKVPIMEKLYMPFIYEDNNGNPVKTNYEAMVVYVPIKKMKQFLSKKNSMSISINERNMKSGRLIFKDKNGNMSDREMECLAVMGLPDTMREFSTYRADSMRAKNEFYGTISDKGMVSLDDIDVKKDDSISRNTLSTYLLGAGVYSNIILFNYMLPTTMDNRDEVRIHRK